ncbi:zinc transporter 3-like [Cucurbita moschata]|uniref:Zinc transporter 3-like n=1 Tax=Cucurbita moschata TaxID=3662 RepID=A0A6J1FEJ2_CUCMO|nr:zinc transporter 3-like [Cucurbita moschata]XP_022936725.1 zinc transporter 3-like [Cucurbita moschata]
MLLAVIYFDVDMISPPLVFRIAVFKIPKCLRFFHSVSKLLRFTIAMADFKLHRLLPAFLVLFVLLVPSVIAAGCQCPEEEEDGGVRNKTLALKYKIVAIATILLAGILGVFIPLLGRALPALSPDKDIFFVVKAFAAGVILATGFIHVLPDAYENLTSPKLKQNPWAKFPFTGLVSMVAAIATLMVDAGASSYFTRLNLNKAQPETDGDGEMHPACHAHGSAKVVGSSTEILRHRVISQVLELGIVVHSVIIGIGMGVSETPSTIKPLVAAITFHQLFEGMGLGGCIAQAKLRTRAAVIMAVFFCLTTPIGIAIGIGVTNSYDEDSPKALIVEGILNAASAGILIYMALVDFLAADFMSLRMQSNAKLQFFANVALILGAALMSLLAIWA